MAGHDEDADHESAPLLASNNNNSGVPVHHPVLQASPLVTRKIISRIKALIIALLPIQVEDAEIESPTSGITTPEVVKAFAKCAGDYFEAVPYCLLQARKSFIQDAKNNPSDYDENMNRRLACEVIARRVVQHMPSNRQHLVLSSEYVTLESDGDVSLPLSALELAVDQRCTTFLSSAESQKTTFALWRGELVQVRDEHGHYVYGLWRNGGKGGFLKHLDPSRLAVPRYQNIFRIILWLIFLLCYTYAIQTPEREPGLEDYIFYIQVIGYTLEELVRVWKIWSFAAFNFWSGISLTTYTIAFIALGYRIADFTTSDPDKEGFYRLRSFQILSCAAPLIWSKLLTTFDLFTYFGTLQVVVGRMLKESAVFFTLLALMGMGFLQALTGLDVADSSRDSTEKVVHSLLQGMLGSPTFEDYQGASDSYPFAMILYYAWNVVTVVILLNVLVALFGSAYSQITDEAIGQYLAFFAGKTIATIRAPDEFVYVAPFNLVEIIILPLEFIMSRKSYNKLNTLLMTALFFPPLCAIALWESRFETRHLKEGSDSLDDDEEEYEEDPEVQGESEISTHKFKELSKVFPDLQSSTSAQILKEVRSLKAQILEIKEKLGK